MAVEPQALATLNTRNRLNRRAKSFLQGLGALKHVLTTVLGEKSAARGTVLGTWSAVDAGWCRWLSLAFVVAVEPRTSVTRKYQAQAKGALKILIARL